MSESRTVLPDKDATANRFYLWLWRGKARSVGERAHIMFKGATWSPFCAFMEQAYRAGYDAGRRSK